MKQIFNWTIGSFFRTIGRTIAFLAMGGLIYYILSTNGFEFGLKELFFDKVNASEIYNGYYFNSNYYSDLNLTNARGSDGLYGYFDVATTTTWNSSYTYNYMYFNSRDLTQYKDGVIQFEYSLDLPQIRSTVTSTIYGSDYCNRWDWLTVDSYNNVIKWGCDRVGESQDSVINDNEYIMPIYSIKAFMLNGSGNDAVPCEVNQNTSRIVCPITAGRNDVHGMLIYTKVFYNSSTNSTYRFKLGKQLLLYKNSDTIINDSINSQTQQQQQNHEETQSYLEDSNTTQAESEATDFFEDFEAPDIGGLGAIITAPLNTIRSLLNSSCSNLVLPLPFVNKNLTLPCMNTIYTEHFGAFFTIYQTIILAVIAYRCIRSIFFDIHGFTNPNDDRIEVMDL